MRGVARLENEPSLSGVFAKPQVYFSLAARPIGAKIKDRYLLLEKLGSGGNGSVYLAADTKKGEKVALKIMEGDEQYDSRMFREIGVSNRVAHRNIVNIKDSGVCQGSQFIVMDYLVGNDLRAEIRKTGGLAWNVIEDIVPQICDGLTALHEKGIIHRDIKPSNIFLAKEGSRTVVKIIDFGLATFGPDDELDEIVGTPAYMAPEMLGGLYDHRMDIYSLGATIYEMLAGLPPFNARTYIELMKMHCDNLPPPLGIRLPHGAEKMVMKALSKNPADRYQTADELKADLLDLPHDWPAKRGIFSTIKEIISFIKFLFSPEDFLSSLRFSDGDLVFDANPPYQNILKTVQI